MTPFIEEADRLIRLAERDYETFSILRAHPDAKLAPTCFHAQQSVEKALKAVLTARQVYFRYTHDLEALFKLLTNSGIIPPRDINDLRRLSPFAVEFRYDDQIIPLMTREDAEAITAAILVWARKLVAEAVV
ncbi:MAG: HEPN domain-containing protein [Rhodocyclaceae bacterium]|nr:HEPN domain-containing protein [Rhodocyclaceae bacterium]